MLLGHARGKVGDLVFSRVNGQQVIRARAAVVKNPQTESQMIQRIILNTIIQAYSRMTEICDHSFEGIPNGQKCMSAFMRKNLAYLRSHVASERADGKLFDEIYAFSPKGMNNFAMNAYIVASGSLPQVEIESVSALNGAKIAITAAGATPTYEEVITSLGLQRGDQLTFIGQEAYTDSRAAFKFARVILDPTLADGSAAPIDTPFLDGAGYVSHPSPRNEGDDITLSFAAGKLGFTLSPSSMFGAAVIVSRQRSDGSWLRSNTQIVLEPGMPHSLIGSYTMQDALDMAYSGALDLQSERYLNNAKRVTAMGAANELEVQTQGGTGVTLVGIRTVAITNTGSSTSGITQAVAAYDTDGNDHLILCDNSYSQAYGKVLNDANGGNVDLAWKVALADVTAPAGASAAAVVLWDGESETSEQAGVQWLIAQGVSPFVFVVPL